MIYWWENKDYNSFTSSSLTRQILCYNWRTRIVLYKYLYNLNSENEANLICRHLEPDLLVDYAQEHASVVNFKWQEGATWLLQDTQTFYCFYAL